LLGKLWAIFLALGIKLWAGIAAVLAAVGRFFKNLFGKKSDK
jgi:hypothetical protein